MATGGNYEWYTWTSTDYNTSAASTSTGSEWYEWNTGNDCTASGTTSDCTWNNWNDTPNIKYYTYSSEGTIWAKWGETYKTVEPVIAYDCKSIKARYEPPKKSSEKIRAEKTQRELQHIWWDYEAECLRREKEEAEERAVECLIDIIGKEQGEVYRETGRLLVHGEKYSWLLKKSGGVFRIGKDKANKYCVHLKDLHSYPETDNIISLAMRLKDDEKAVEKEANCNGEAEVDNYCPKGGNCNVIKFKEVIKKRINRRFIGRELMAASF